MLPIFKVSPRTHKLEKGKQIDFTVIVGISALVILQIAAKRANVILKLGILTKDCFFLSLNSFELTHVVNAIHFIVNTNVKAHIRTRAVFFDVQNSLCFAFNLMLLLRGTKTFEISPRVFSVANVFVQSKIKASLAAK